MGKRLRGEFLPSGSQQQQQQQQEELGGALAVPSRPSTPASQLLPPLPSAQTTTRMLTPSGMAARLRPDLDPAAAALAASAPAARVELREIGAATHVAHFAFAAYGYLLYLWGREIFYSFFLSFLLFLILLLWREREREG